MGSRSAEAVDQVAAVALGQAPLAAVAPQIKAKAVALEFLAKAAVGVAAQAKLVQMQPHRYLAKAGMGLRLRSLEPLEIVAAVVAAGPGRLALAALVVVETVHQTTRPVQEAQSTLAAVAVAVDIHLLAATVATAAPVWSSSATPASTQSAILAEA